MNFKLIKASSAYKNAIKNLMQFYMYDFSEYLKTDVEEDGLFATYKYLDDYWQQESNSFPYIIISNEKYVGFVLVKFIESTKRSYFSVAEFFIMKKYRREGIGKAVAHQVFDLYKGRWEVFQKESNKPAQLFWNRVISEYTKGCFEERFVNDKRIQNFEN